METHEILIRIGFYGTPEPMAVSSLDDFLIKKCFVIYLEQLIDLKATLTPSDKVLIVGQSKDILPRGRTFFEGTLAKAVEWAGNKSYTIAYNSMEHLPIRSIWKEEAKHLFAEWGDSGNVKFREDRCTTQKEKSENKKLGDNI